MQQSLNESSIGAAEGYEDRFSSKLGQGLGSFASFLVPGTLVAKTAGLAGKAAKVSDLGVLLKRCLIQEQHFNS